MRWIWIDRIVEFTSGKSARAIRNTSMAEDLYADHFPGYPVMPAALMLEGLAQTGGILVGEANGFREKVVLAKIPRAHFTREVLAGEQVIYEVELLHLRPEGASVLGRVLAGEPELGRPPRRLPVRHGKHISSHRADRRGRGQPAGHRRGSVLAGPAGWQERRSPHHRVRRRQPADAHRRRGPRLRRPPLPRQEGRQEP